MGSYLARYRAGECAEVWTELVALGEAVRKGPVASDARAVATETMARVRVNLERLVARLRAIGYRFGELRRPAGPFWHRAPIHTPPRPDAAACMDELEAAWGPAPLSLRAWNEVVGQVSLLGYHPAWPEPLWPEPPYFDPLLVDPIDDAMIAYLGDEYDGWRDECAAHGVSEVGPFGVPIAPDVLHKADISRGSPYTIPLPCAAADAPLLYEQAHGTFVAYLRRCFQWGGFPGLERCHESRRPWEHLAYLTEGLLPI
jgi:hypothetical protein